MERVPSLSQPTPNDTPQSAPAAEWVAGNPAATVLFTAMQTFWQGYYACHRALLEHAQAQNLTPDSAQAVADYAAGAAKHTAIKQEFMPIDELAKQFHELCGPVLDVLAQQTKAEPLTDDKDT